MLDDFWTQVGAIAGVAAVVLAVIALYVQVRGKNTATVIQRAERVSNQQLVINSPNTTLVNQGLTSNGSEIFASSPRRRRKESPVLETTIAPRQEIIDNVLNDATPLAPLVGKALQLARQLGRGEESKWLERELYGYDAKPNDLPTTFPEYRRVEGTARVQMTGFTTSGPFDREISAERMIFVSFPVSEIESDVRSAKNHGSEAFIFWLPIPKEWIPPKNLNATVTSEREGQAPFVVEVRSLQRLLQSLRLRIHRFVSTS